MERDFGIKYVTVELESDVWGTGRVCIQATKHRYSDTSYYIPLSLRKWLKPPSFRQGLSSATGLSLVYRLEDITS